MSAETLHQAAAQIRKDFAARQLQASPRTFHHALADWLELEAEADTRCCNCTVSHHPGFHRYRALAVARAYLGGVS